MSLSRSEQMSRIRGRDTGPEAKLRTEVWRAGLRYRLYQATPAGRPDLVFPSRRVAVFIDGCQWHGCPEHYVRPRSNAEFWAAKLAANVNRDVRQTAELERLSWRVVRIWEHEIRRDVEGAAGRVVAAVRGARWRPVNDLRVVSVDVVDPSRDLERRHILDLRIPIRRFRRISRRKTTKD